MSTGNDWDYLIVGQGLAGSLLAWVLHRRGRRVLVVDDGHRTAASVAAAGLVNPLAGLRFSRPAGVTEWLQTAQALYAELGQEFGRTFYHPLPMVRLFRSAEQVRFWERRAADPQTAPLLGERFAPGASGQPIRAPFGGFHQHATGYLETEPLLTALREVLLRHGGYRSTAIDYGAIELHADGVRWQGVRARTLVFCEGYRGRDNPWFGWLPFRPDRGEILTFSAHGPMPERIVNGAHWLIPLVDGGYRCGATHDHHSVAPAVTAAARDELLAGLAALLEFNPRIEVTAQRAGVRPATADRAPLLGRHPNAPALALFNGFGAKGSLQIPWYAERLAEHLEAGAALPPEADIARHA